MQAYGNESKKGLWTSTSGRSFHEYVKYISNNLSGKAHNNEWCRRTQNLAKEKALNYNRNYGRSNGASAEW